MSTTTKRDLIDRVANETRCVRADVRKVVQSFLDQVIVEISQGNRLEFRDFGVFEVRDRGQRIVHNPRTQKRVIVPPCKVVRFKAGRRMREALEGLEKHNGAFSVNGHREPAAVS